jgi:hypothetical protein
VIRAIDTVTGETRTVAGRPGVAGVGLGTLPAALNQPGGIAIAPNGDLYLTDVQENTVLKIESQ